MASKTSQVNFSFSIKNDNFSNKVQSMNKEMKTFQEEMKQASNEVIKSGKSLETLGNKYNAINKALEQAKSKVKLYEEQITKQNSSIEKSKNKLTELSAKKAEVNKKYDESVKATGKESEASLKLKDELDKLNQQYKNTEKSITSKEKTLQTYAVSLSQAETAVSNLEVELKNCADAIQDQSNKFIEASENLNNNAERFKAVGGTIDDVSNKVIGISTAVLTAVGALGKMSFELENGVAKINTLVNDSGDSLEKYKNGIVDLSNNTGVAVGDLSEGLYNAISASVDYSDSLAFVETANKTAVGGFTTIGSAVDVLTTIINGYGLEADDATEISDKLFQVQNKGKTTVNELSAVMGKVVPIAGSLNVNLDNVGGAMASMTAQGINTAEASTRLVSMFNELGDSGSDVGKILEEKTGKSFSTLMSEGKNLHDVLKIVQDSTEGNSDAFNNLWSSSEAKVSALALLNQEGEKFKDSLDAISNSAGATDSAYNTMAETTEYKLKKSINELKNSFIKLGEGATPLIENVSEAISKVAEVLGEMDSETVTNIANMALWGAGIGVAGKAVGGLVTGIGGTLSVLGKLSGLLASSGSIAGVMGTAMSTAGIGTAGLGTALGVVGGTLLPVTATLATLTAGVYAYKKGNDACNSSIADTKGEYSALEKGMAALMGTQLRNREELEKQGLVYKDFNENISEDFQDKVKDMTTDIHEFGFAVGEINLDGVFSDDEVSDLTSRVSSALDNCKSAIDSKYEVIQSGLKDAFSVDGVIDENENSLLEYWNNRGNTEKEEAQNLQNEINNIITNARNEGGTLTSEEEATIKDYYAQIKRIELEALASNQYEIEYAQQEFNNRIKGMDAESAKELLSKRYEQYKEQEVATKTNYDTLIAQAKQGYESLSAEDKAHVDDTVNRLNSAKEEELRINKEKYDSNLQYAYECNQNLRTEFNKFTGEMVSERDKAYYDEYEQYRNHYQDLNNVTESGYKRMYNSATGTWDDLYVQVNKETGLLEGVYDLNTQNLVTMNKDNKGVLQDEVSAWNNTSQGILMQTILSGNAYQDMEGRIKDSSGKIIGHVESVVDENGNLVQSIVDLNGNKINVQGNWQEAINKANEVNTTIQNIKDKTVKISVNQQGYANVKGSGYGTMYATGTVGTTQNEIATINEKGWELIDTKMGDVAYSLGRSIAGEMAYLPENTRVTTALASTQKMEASINKEVTNQVSNSNAQISRALENLANTVANINKNNNTNLNVDDVFDKIVIETVTNLNDKEIMRVITPLMDKSLNKYNKLRGR